MTNRDWLNTLTVEEFVIWLVCDEVFDPKMGKLVEPMPRFPSMKRLITEGYSRQGTIMKINIERFFKEWLEEKRKAK